MRPLFRTLVSVSHRSRLATGSMPVVGSSKNTTGGSPTRAIAVLNLRLLPPLESRKHKNYLTEHSKLDTFAETALCFKYNVKLNF